MVSQLLLPAVAQRLVQLSTRYATAHVVVEAPQEVAAALLRCSAPLQVGRNDVWDAGWAPWLGREFTCVRTDAWVDRYS